MHDIRAIRENPAAFDAGLARRGLSGLSSEILALDESRRNKIQAAEEALAERNKASKEVGAAKARGDDAEFERLRALVGAKKDEIAKLEDEAKTENAKLTEMLMGLPNIPREDIPDGTDESENVELHRHGSIRNFSFTPKEHYDVPAAAVGFDFEAAAKISGARFMVLKGNMTRLHRALAQFMLDTHVDKSGLTEMWAPVLVREEAMIGTGQLPKFAEDSYKTEQGWWLIPTSEVSLTNMVAGEILDEDKLPIRMAAHSQCFRSEAGSAGRDTAGILRQHQFEKVEMVSITTAENSPAELDAMTKRAEGILEALEIPYRTVVLCTGDLGFGMRRTHDIEAWLPGQNMFREISSCSVAEDFQARRMNARVRRNDGTLEFVHTLNGSGLAIGRTLIAVIENYQQEDGSIEIPTVLHRYLGGKTRISTEGVLE